MTKKVRRMRTFARTASKSMERNLIDKAKQLMEDPFIVLPSYNDRYSKKYFDKIRKKIAKINDNKENKEKLEKFSNKHGLFGAVAGTLLLSYTEKAPYLAVGRFPHGEVTYAQRGKAEKEKLIAVQHFDDPILRLLGIKDIAIKKNLHIYSWDDGFMSTGINPNPPKEFIDFIIAKIGFKLEGNVMTCGDISPQDIENNKYTKQNFLKIYWKSANLYIGICENCARSTKNTFFNITKYLIEPDISSDFSFNIIGKMTKDDITPLNKVYSIDKYLSGELTDFEFIKKNIDEQLGLLKESDETILMLDGISYGSDIDKFIDALNPKDYEKEGLKNLLGRIKKPIVIDNATPNKVLEMFWDDYGKDILFEIVNDRQMADDLFSLDDTPSNVLEEASTYVKRKGILSELPRYKSLPPLACFADNIAKTYRTYGEKKCLSELRKRPDTPKGKSLEYAFLLAFDKGNDLKWKFSQVEIEYGEFLKDYVKKLLDSKPENYHKALKELLSVSGSSESIDDKVV